MAEYRINYTQSNFTGGIVAAELYGRNDFNKVKTGLKKCTNWTIREAGGLEFRRGTKYVNTIPVAAGNKFKIASISDILIVFGASKIYWLKEDNTWGEVSYPATPNLDSLMFEELKQRLYFYDGTINLSEIYLVEEVVDQQTQETAMVPHARYTKFEEELVGTTLVAQTTPDASIDPRVDVEHSYTVALMSADGEKESIAITPGATDTANVELSGTEYVTVTAVFPRSTISEYAGGRVLFFKKYQGIYYYLTSLDINGGGTIKGSGTNPYTRDPQQDTTGAYGWTYVNNGTTNHVYTSSEYPAVADIAYSDSTLTTQSFAITDFYYEYKDQGEYSVDTSKMTKEKPVYLTSDGYLPYVNSIADYGQRLFLTLSLRLEEDNINIIFTQAGNINSLAYTKLRGDDEAGFLAVPVSHFDSWGRVVSGLELMFCTNYTIQHVSGYGDMQIEPLLFDGMSKTVQPVRTRRSLLYTNPNNKNIYDLSYNEYGQYDNPDLTLLIKYIFEDKEIKRLEIKDYPVKTIYVLCADGDLYCLTYVKEQNIYAWYKLEHFGKVHDIHVVNLETEDEIYIVTKDNGNYIVELAYHRTDTVYTDCTVLVRRASIADNVITGLPACLEGKKVRVFDLGNNRYYGDYDIAHPQTIEEGGNIVQIDDVEFDGYTVVDGSITLDDSVYLEGDVLVGLPYYAVAETIPLEFQDQNGNSTIGRKKTISDAYLRYGDSRGLTYKTLGREYDCGICKKDIVDNAEFLERGQVRLNTESEYKWDSTIKLLQRQPYPARIESITLGLNFNDKS